LKLLEIKSGAYYTPVCIISRLPSRGDEFSLGGIIVHSALWIFAVRRLCEDILEALEERRRLQQLNAVRVASADHQAAARLSLRSITKPFNARCDGSGGVWTPAQVTAVQRRTSLTE
jgi:hypothetical protein